MGENETQISWPARKKGWGSWDILGVVLKKEVSLAEHCSWFFSCPSDFWRAGSHGYFRSEIRCSPGLTVLYFLPDLQNQHETIQIVTSATWFINDTLHLCQGASASFEICSFYESRWLPLTDAYQKMQCFSLQPEPATSWSSEVPVVDVVWSISQEMLCWVLQSQLLGPSGHLSQEQGDEFCCSSGNIYFQLI